MYIDIVRIVKNKLLLDIFCCNVSHDMIEIRNRINDKNTAILINESEISYGLSTTTNSLL